MSADATIAAAASPAAARERLFGDILTLQEIRAARFLPGPLDHALLDRMALQGESLLRALAVVDDSAPRIEDSGEQPADPQLHRLEAKLDVLTQLIAGIAANQGQQDPLVALHWSAHGAELDTDTVVAAGSTGRFRVSASDWLPTPLLLPATVIAATREHENVTRIWLQFGPLSPSYAEALERHVFRIHRREVAERRRR